MIGDLLAQFFGDIAADTLALRLKAAFARKSPEADPAAIGKDRKPSVMTTGASQSNDKDPR